MAGRGGSEQSLRVESDPAAGALPVLDGDGPVALDRWGDPSKGEVYLTSRPESASRARRLAVCVMRAWGLDSRAETVELLVSELVGNAVRHAGGGFGLRMRRRRGWIRAEVRDPSRALPCLLPAFELDVSGGRGLFLVDRLSDRWGVDLQPRGKTTWFELRVPDV
jgi:anti-sigma regulatory factor (Ser/Thr protein kinase)